MTAAFYFCRISNLSFHESNQEYCDNMTFGPDPSLGRSFNCLVLEIIPNEELTGEWKLYTPCGVWKFKGLDKYGKTEGKVPLWLQQPSRDEFEERRQRSLERLRLEKLNDRFHLVTSLYQQYWDCWKKLPSVEPDLSRCLILKPPTNLEKEEIEMHLNLTIRDLFETELDLINNEMRKALRKGDEHEKWFDAGKYTDKPIHRSIFIQYHTWMRDY